jgi:hypothetical protein
MIISIKTDVSMTMKQRKRNSLPKQIEVTIHVVQPSNQTWLHLVDMDEVYTLTIEMHQ